MKTALLTMFMMINAALATWFIRGFVAAQWKSDQTMHIRWNVDQFSHQYNRIDKLGNKDLRRDYVTNFCHNACILLNLDCKTAPNTSNLVERYYFDWDERIDNAERAASTPEINNQAQEKQESGDLEPQK